MTFPDRRTANVLLTVLLFGAVGAIAYAARHILLIFVLAIFFAYLLNPAVDYLQRHALFFRDIRGVAVVRLYVVVLILIAFSAHGFAPSIMRNTLKVIDQTPAILDGLSTGEIATQVGEKYGWSNEQQMRLRTLLLRHHEDVQGLAKWIDHSLSQGVQIIGWMALVPVLAIFFLWDGKYITNALIHTAFPEDQRQRARMIADQLHIVLTNYIRAQLLLCGLSLSFYAIVLFLFRFPHVIGLSILGGVLEFIPVIGWISTAVVIVGVGVVNGLHWMWMAVLLLAWRIAQDYINLPRIIGHRLEIHPLAAIFAVLVGGAAGGIVGIYLAVPVAASIYVIWKMRTCPEPTAGVIPAKIPAVVVPAPPPEENPAQITAHER